MNIEHIGIAVRSLDEAVETYQNLLGMKVSKYEEIHDERVRVAMLPIGDTRIELLEPMDSTSPIEKFLSRRGPGIHHLSVRVDDIRAMLARSKAAGARLIDEVPRRGADDTLIAFIHPSSTGGVLLELVEHEK